MFYLSDGRVKLTDSQADVCGVDEIESVISALMALQGEVTTPKEIDDDRYTLEGIDRQFKADPGFVPSKEVWWEDSVVDWRGIPGAILFQRYQRHAETYCWGCMDYSQDPTYEGFRQWLIQLRDMAGEED
jgi:hypothetical protein